MDCGKVWAGPSDYTKPCEEQDGVRRGQAGARGALRRHGRRLRCGGVSAEIALRRGFGEDAPRRGCVAVRMGLDVCAVIERSHQIQVR
jgi:hypothetical protein